MFAIRYPLDACVASDGAPTDSRHLHRRVASRRVASRRVEGNALTRIRHTSTTSQAHSHRSGRWKERPEDPPRANIGACTAWPFQQPEPHFCLSVPLFCVESRAIYTPRSAGSKEEIEISPCLSIGGTLRGGGGGRGGEDWDTFMGDTKIRIRESR